MDPLPSDPISSTISDDERVLSEMQSEDHHGSMKTSDTSTDGGNEQHGDADDGFPHPPCSEGDESNYDEEYDDYDAPEEAWHPNSTGPISRDEFHRYQSLVEEQIHRLRLERDEFRVLWNKEKARADSGIKRYRETQRMIERESKMDFEKWERSLRKRMNEPVWPPPDEVPRSNFLYDNVEDVMTQHCITTTLLHAQARLNAKDPDQAEELAWEALKLAKTFDYEPLEGRCRYWLGRVEFERGNNKRARMFFMKARSCIGKYKEGDDVEVYLSLFQPGLSDLEKKRIILRHAEAMFSQIMERQKTLRKGNKQGSRTEDDNPDVVSETNLPATEHENREDENVDCSTNIPSDDQRRKRPTPRPHKLINRPPLQYNSQAMKTKSKLDAHRKKAKKDMVREVAMPKWAIYDCRSLRSKVPSNKVKGQGITTYTQLYPNLHPPDCEFTFIRPLIGVSARARRTDVLPAQRCENLISLEIWESVQGVASRMAVSLSRLEFERSNPVGAHQLLVEAMEDHTREIRWIERR